MAVAARVLQGVDADDGALVVGERVAVRRDLLADPLETLAVETHERDGETGPQLVLELFEDVAWGDDEDLVAPTTADELAEDETHFEGFAETDCVGDEQAGTQTGERLVCSAALILECFEELTIGDGEVGIGRGDRGLADDRLEEQATAAEVRRVVGDECGVFWPERLDVVELGEERALGVSHQRRHTDAAHHETVGRGVKHLADQPLLIADLDLGTGSDQRFEFGRRHRHGANPIAPVLQVICDKPPSALTRS